MSANNHFLERVSQFLIRSIRTSWMLLLELLQIYTYSKFRDFRIPMSYNCFYFGFISQSSLCRSACFTAICQLFFLMRSVTMGMTSFRQSSLPEVHETASHSQYCRFFSTSISFSIAADSLVQRVSSDLSSGLFSPSYWMLSSTLANNERQCSIYLLSFAFLSITCCKNLSSLSLTMVSSSSALSPFSLWTSDLLFSSLVCMSTRALISFCLSFSFCSSYSFLSLIFSCRQFNSLVAPIIFFFSLKLSSSTTMTQDLSSSCFLNDSNCSCKLSSSFSFSSTLSLILSSLLCLWVSCFSLEIEQISLFLSSALICSLRLRLSFLTARKTSS